MNIKLLVLRCVDIDISKEFYEKLGLRFKKEQHGSGPIHYASEQENFVLELYPAKEGEADNTRIGLEISDLNSVLSKIDINGEYENNGTTVRITSDPDGRKIELYENQS